MKENLSNTSFIENGITSISPCVVLTALQSDLTALAKAKELLPFKRSYRLSVDWFIEISIEQQENGNFQLSVTSNNSSERATEPTLKKLVDKAHMLFWRILSTSLTRNKLSPCASMSHKGTDELLALYQCLTTIKNEPEQPYAMTLKGPRGSYELFSLRDKGNFLEVVIETNYVYGNSLKWRAEVEFAHQVIDRTGKIISDVLGEWLRPGGLSLRRELDRETNLTRRISGTQQSGDR